MAGMALGGKSGAKPTSTGTPAWTSGATGNGLVGAAAPNTQNALMSNTTATPATTGPVNNYNAGTNTMNPQTGTTINYAQPPAAAAPAATGTTIPLTGASGSAGSPTGMTTGTTGTTAATGTNTTTGGTQPGALTGEWWKPGTDAYNKMNNLLATNPMGALVQIFQQGGMTPEMNTVMQNLLNSSGANSWMTQAADLFKNLGTGTAAQDFQNVYNTAGQPGAAQTNLGSMAAGGMINNNPYLNDIVSQAEQDATTNVNQMFAAGGRYGSAMDQGAVGKAVASVNDQLRSDQLNKDLANMLTANNYISNEQLGRLGIQNTAAGGLGTLQTAGAQGLGGLGQNAMSNWLSAQGAAAGLSNQGMQNLFSAMGQLSNVQNNKLFDANAQTAVGNKVDASTQAVIDSLKNMWQTGDMSGWAKLGGLISAAQGSAGNYGTAQSTTKQSSSPGIMDILGLILAFA